MMGGKAASDKLFEKANGVATDAFSNIRVVNAYRMSDEVSRLYKQLIVEPTRVEIRR